MSVTDIETNREDTAASKHKTEKSTLHQEISFKPEIYRILSSRNKGENAVLSISKAAMEVMQCIVVDTILLMADGVSRT
jgi:hypothetical protein